MNSSDTIASDTWQAACVQLGFSMTNCARMSRFLRQSVLGRPTEDNAETDHIVTSQPPPVLPEEGARRLTSPPATTEDGSEHSESDDFGLLVQPSDQRQRRHDAHVASDAVPRVPGNRLPLRTTRDRGREDRYPPHPDQLRRSHSPPRLQRSHLTEGPPPRPRASPPAPAVSRPSPSPDVEITRSSLPPGSPDNGPANAPSPRTAAAWDMLAMAKGRPSRAPQATTPLSVPNSATPNTSALPSRQGSGRGGPPRAAPASGGSSRAAGGSTAGPSSSPARAQLPPRPSGVHHAYGPYQYAYAMPPPGLPPPGYAPGAYAPGAYALVPVAPPPGMAFAPAYPAYPGYGIAHPKAPSAPPSKSEDTKGASAKKKKSYKCAHPMCYNRPPFDRQRDWEVHYSAHFPNDDAFPCTQPGCTKRYKWLSTRDGHIRKDHPGVL